jgi:predicted transcriptional regulator
MNTLDLKSDLYALIDKIEDIDILREIKTLLVKKLKSEEGIDFWEKLPDALKLEIEESIKEADRGEVIEHEEVMKQIKEKYKL